MMWNGVCDAGTGQAGRLRFPVPGLSTANPDAVRQWKDHGSFDCRSRPVHECGARHPQSGTRQYPRPHTACDPSPCPLRVRAALNPSGLPEIHADRDQRRRGKSARVLPEHRVAAPVREHCGFPAHATDKTDHLQTKESPHEKPGGLPPL